MSPQRLDRAHGWFERYGAPLIFFSRFFPLIRAAFPYAAGVARMSYWKFVSLAALGSIIWIGGLGLLGRAVGHAWPSWRHHLEYVDYAAVAVLVIAILYFIVRRSRSDRGGSGGPAADAISD
jgi:membrane protein DedA with SNARE-associated domain